jgi:hypothetical protein
LIENDLKTSRQRQQQQQQTTKLFQEKRRSSGGVLYKNMTFLFMPLSQQILTKSIHHFFARDYLS